MSKHQPQRSASALASPTVSPTSTAATPPTSTESVAAADQQSRAAADPLLLAMFKRVDELAENFDRAMGVVETLLDRMTDTSHLTYAEIAKLQGISTSAARRRYGQWLEAIPNTKKQGVPRERVIDGWVAKRVLRAAAKSRRTA